MFNRDKHFLVLDHQFQYQDLDAVIALEKKPEWAIKEACECLEDTDDQDTEYGIYQLTLIGSVAMSRDASFVPRNGGIPESVPVPIPQPPTTMSKPKKKPAARRTPARKEDEG